MPIYLNTEFTAQGKVWKALLAMYERLEKHPPKRRREMLPIAVFSAFTIEAYLNSVGSRVVPFWNEIERVPWKNKVKILHSAAKKKPKWGEDPLQFLTEIFDLRDRLAHGKPEKMRRGPYATYPEAERALEGEDAEPAWYKKLDSEWLAASHKRLDTAMRYFASLHGFEESEFTSTATTTVDEE